MSRRILILGGTADARALAERLAGRPDHEVILSLAGVTRDPLLPAGVTVRRGGFGGADGLAGFLREHGIAELIDATHPFAVRISANAAAAARAAGVPLLRLDRPPWRPGPGDRWISVPDLASAPAAIPAGVRRVFLAVGRQSAGAFAVRPDLSYVLRQIDPPDTPPPLPDCVVLTGRPPRDPAAEAALFRAHGIEALVVKNSGGPANAKLTAARELGLPVVMVERAAAPETAGVESRIGVVED